MQLVGSPIDWLDHPRRGGETAEDADLQEQRHDVMAMLIERIHADGASNKQASLQRPLAHRGWV